MFHGEVGFCGSGARRGACLFGYLLTPPLVLLLPPIPPAPFPGGEGGDSRLFHARGAAPCIPGAEPARHWERGRTTRPAEGLPCLSPACPAFSLLFCPLSPKPPSPVGKGEIQGYFMQGAPPLASPGAEPGRHLHDQRFLFVYGGAVPAAKERGDRGRGTSAFEMVLSPGAGIANAAGGVPSLSPADSALNFLFLPPIPPTPFPGGEGGDSRLFHARGFAPCIPSIKPLAALAEPEKQAPGEGLPPALPVDLAAVVSTGGLIFLVACRPCLLLSFLPPIPPAPLPQRGRGRPRLFHARGFAPCIPSIKPLAALAEPEKQAPGEGLPPALPVDLAAVVSTGGLIFLVACRPCLLLSFLPPSPEGKDRPPGKWGVNLCRRKISTGRASVWQGEPATIGILC